MDDLDDSDDGRGAPAAPARGARDRDRALHARFSFRALGPILVPRSARWRGGRSPTVIRIIQIIQVIRVIIQLAFPAYLWLSWQNLGTLTSRSYSVDFNRSGGPGLFLVLSGGVSCPSEGLLLVLSGMWLRLQRGSLSCLKPSYFHGNIHLSISRSADPTPPDLLKSPE